MRSRKGRTRMSSERKNRGKESEVGERERERERGSLKRRRRVRRVRDEDKKGEQVEAGGELGLRVGRAGLGRKRHQASPPCCRLQSTGWEPVKRLECQSLESGQSELLPLLILIPRGEM